MNFKLHLYLSSVLLLFCFKPAEVVAQQGDTGSFLSNDYLRTQWTIEDGLPVNTVYDILMAESGYIWMTSHDGLVRFDGLEFKVYNSAEYPELKGNRIQFIEEASDGSILIQSEGLNFIKYKDGVFTHLLSLEEGLAGNGTNKGFYKDDAGDLWFGGVDGIFLYTNGELTRFEPDIIQIPVYSVKYVSNDEVWFISVLENTLYRFGNGKLTPIIEDTEGVSLTVAGDSLLFSDLHSVYLFDNNQKKVLFTSEEFEIFGIEKKPGSDIYINTADPLGYFRYSNGRVEHIPEMTPSTIPGGFLRTGPDGSLWMMTANQVFKNEKLIFQEDINIEEVQQDREGNIWIATTRNGLIRLKPNLFYTIGVEQGLTRSIYPLFQSRDSMVWIGMFGTGLASIKRGVLNTGYSFENEPDLAYMQTFAEKEDGTLLMSALGQGVLYLDRTNSILRPYPVPLRLEEGGAFAMFIDSRKRLWVGTNPMDDGGLYVEEKGAWTHESGNHGMPYTRVRYITEAPNGDIWFATQGYGIIRYDNQQYQVYNTSFGISSDFPRALYFTVDEKNPKNHILWVGYEDRGIDRIEVNNGMPDLNSITNYQEKDGLFANSVHIILEDDHERFWINSNQGIFRIHKDELETFHEGRISHVYSRGYTEEEGLLNREGNGGIQPAGFRAFDGSIWFPSQEGVVRFHPDSIVSNKFIPPVVIQKLNSKDKNITVFDEEINLTSDQRDLEISYASLSFLNAPENQYKYILRGYENEWNLVGNRRTAYYTNLPPGTYTFMVQGSNNEGIWNTKGATLTIHIAPFFYETWQFYLLLSLIVISLVAGIVMVRNQYFQKREEKLRKEVNLRTKELLEEKNKTELQARKLKELDEVKSRFFTNISHELRTPLTLIIGPLEQLISGETDPTSPMAQEQKELMLRNSQRLIKLIDQILDVSRLESGAIPLNYEPVSIQDFIKKNVAFFRESLDSKNIQFEFRSDVQTGEVFMDQDKIEKVLGNLLSNAIKFTPERGKISITVRELTESYRIKVKDTGIGIDPSFLPKIFDRFYQIENQEVTSSEGFGIGLSITKELIELHSGSIEVESQPGVGTVFTVTLLKGTRHFNTDDIQTGMPSDEISSLPSVLPDTDQEKARAELPVNLSEDTTTVMVIDDHPDMRFFITSLLAGKYKLMEASSGTDAYKKIKSSPPDLIIADIMMPEMDGMQLNRLLKDNPVTASIPFIFLTAKKDKNNKLKSIREGADVYLTKPFDADELLANVSNLIQSRYRLREQLLNDLSGLTPFFQKKKEETDTFLNNLYEVMEKEFSNPELTVNAVQEKMFMSRSSFYRTMNDKTGLNTQQFINKFRLDKAKEMLLQDQGNISEIAYACGFNSLSYFSRSFKERFGKTPSEFLKQYS